MRDPYVGGFEEITSDFVTSKKNRVIVTKLDPYSMHNTLVELKRFDIGTSKDIMYKNSMLRSDSLRATEVNRVVSRPAFPMAR